LSYGGNRVFAVGSEPRGGLTDSIPPGRYRVEQEAGKTDGFWQRCNDLFCGASTASIEHVIATGFATEGGSLMDIVPADAAVYLYDVTLTPVTGG
jgi:hypothetical protein